MKLSTIRKVYRAKVTYFRIEVSTLTKQQFDNSIIASN